MRPICRAQLLMLPPRRRRLIMRGAYAAICARSLLLLRADLFSDIFFVYFFIFISLSPLITFHFHFAIFHAIFAFAITLIYFLCFAFDFL